MRFKSVVSRQLNKRLSHNFTYANMSQDFNISLSTLLRDFGLTPYEYMRDNLRHVTKALDEMVEKRVIRKYEVKNVYDAGRKNKLIDAVILVKPDLNFVNLTIRANVKQGRVKELNGQAKR